MVYMATAGLLKYSNKTTAEQCSVNMVLIGRIGRKNRKF